MADSEPIEGTLQTAVLAGNDEPKRNGVATILQLVVLVLTALITLGTAVAGDSETAKLTGTLGAVAAGIVSLGKYAQYTALILGQARGGLPAFNAAPITINTAAAPRLAEAMERHAAEPTPVQSSTAGTTIPGAGHTQSGAVTDDGVEITPGEGDPLPPEDAV